MCISRVGQVKVMKLKNSFIPRECKNYKEIEKEKTPEPVTLKNHEHLHI